MKRPSVNPVQGQPPAGVVRRHDDGRWRGLRLTIMFVCMVTAFLLSISASQGWLQFTWKGSPILGQPKLEDGVYDLQSIQVLNRVLLHLHENYVDPSRFSPRRMLAAGLEEVQKQVAEVIVRFDRPISDQPQEVTVVVGDKTQVFRLKDISSLWEVGLKYQEIFSFIQDNLPADVERRDIEYTAINGMLKTLDPHSVLLSPKSYQSMTESNRGNFGGLGITIRMIEGKLLVVNPMQDTPASRAGVLRGDEILKIDNTWTQNMDLNAAVSLLRGEPGTEVKLLMARADWEIPRDVLLTRDTIKIPAVSHATLDPTNKLGYVHLKGFQANTYNDMVEALSSLSDTMGGLNGLVLDLRGNPGGLLEQAIQISDEFLNDGTIVTTVGSAGKYRKPYPAYKNGTQPSYPIVVLTNSGSASASEIVAGALKNHDRAIIVGDTTFGKGSVQVLYELQDGSALKLTIAQYLTPGDISIQSVGVTPDIQLQPMRVQSDSADLFAQSWVRREATLASHLDHDTALGGKPSAILPYLAPDDPAAADTSADDDDALPDLGDDEPLPPERDPQVRLARELLLAAGTTWERPALLKSLSDDITRLGADEDHRLVEKLQAQGVDWSAGAAPGKKPKLDVRWSFNQDALAIDPSLPVDVDVTLTNNGADTLYRLHGVTTSTHPTFDDIELTFGKLAPGQSITRTLHLKLDKQQRQRHDHIDLKLRALPAATTDLSDLADLAPLTTSRSYIQSVDLPSPLFAITYALLDVESGNGDGLVNPSEDLTVRLYVENLGEGVAPRPVAFLRSLNGPQVEIRQGRASFDPIPPGGRAFMDFTFHASSELSGDPLSFELHLYDKIHNRAVMEKATLPVRIDLSAPQLKPVSSFARVTAPDAPLRSTPSPDATLIALAADGDGLDVLSQSGAFLLVSAGDIRGWIASSQAQLSSEAITPPAKPLPMSHASSPPRVLLKAPPSTDKAQVKLSAAISDDGLVKDCQVFVFNDLDHRADAQKVAYRLINTPSSDLSFDIPLKPGLNRVRVSVRDDDGMDTFESIYIYRR
jgi:carboxyl-terminal processing protease